MTTQGERIASLETKTETVYKEVFGNGSEGLAKTVVRLQDNISVLNDNVPKLNESIEALRTLFSGFEKFKTETEVLVKEKARLETQRETNRKWFIGTIIAIVGIGATILGIVIF